MQPLGTKVDDHCVANTSGAEIAECLSDVFGSDGLDGFQFDDEAALNEKVSEVVSKNGTVCIAYLQRLLAFDCNAALSKPVSESILIDFLKMPTAEVGVQFEGGLPNCVAEESDLAFVSRSCWHVVGGIATKGTKVTEGNVCSLDSAPTLRTDVWVVKGENRRDALCIRTVSEDMEIMVCASGYPL